MRRLFNNEGFRDNDIGRALDLEEIIDMEPFDLKKAKEMVHDLHSELENRSESIGLPAFIYDNFQKVGKVYELNQMEVYILTAICIQRYERVFCDCFNVIQNKTRIDYYENMARMLHLDVKKFSEHINAKSPLMSQGILKWTKAQGPRLSLSFYSLSEKLLSDETDICSIVEEIVNPAPSPSLTYEDYPHLKDTLQMLRSHLRAAMKVKRLGVNIYIHGGPGTGKSELVRVIAREMRAKLYEVLFTDGDGDPISGDKRLESLRAAQAFLKKQRALLVFDEAEDVFSGESLSKRSLASERKAWMNRMLESNPVPTFWISNSIYGLDAAFVRRFDFVFELETPPRTQRKRTFKRICKNSISENILDNISECDDLTPAVVAKAHSVASNVAKTGKISADQAFTQILKHTLKAQGHRTDIIEKGASKIPKVYNLSYLNADTPLEPISSKLAECREARICLYGPPGTGKTTYGHWLAKELSVPLIVKKASDLMSPYVGMTERNLARAFEDAKQDKAILLIDEVDSFLQDRRSAVRSWQVTEVNEMLTQMENFEGIFIASTNLMDGLDQAALRRFDLKIKVDFMRSDQVVKLYQSHCKDLKLGVPRKDDLGLAEQLNNATPGDFANVTRQHRLRQFSTPRQYLEAVLEECEIKEGSGNRNMGFA